MNLQTLVSSILPTPDAALQQVLVARYQRLRAAAMTVNNRLAAGLAPSVIEEGGRKLGMLQRGALLLSNEYDLNVLMDYCLYNVRRGRRNEIVRFLDECPPHLTSDEMACLQAMKEAIYSVFAVEAVERGVGMTVVDLLTDRRYLVLDLNLSRTASPGLVLLSRLVLFENFAMTGGAVLPLGILPPQEIAQMRDNLREDFPNGGTADFDPACLIAGALRRGASERIFCAGPSGSHRDAEVPAPRRDFPQQRVQPPWHGASARRKLTQRCRCGSGKMYKNCCMKQRQT